MKWKLVGYVLLVACLILPATPALAATGETEVTGTVPLVASEVAASNIGYYSATINWKTNGNATSQVYYDTEYHDDIADYAYFTDEDTALVSQHSITLTGLSSGTTYHYRVKSRIPETDFIAISEDYTFTTSTPPAPPPADGGEPIYSVTMDLFGVKGYNYVSYRGEVQRTIEGTSADGNLGITIPRGTIAKEKDGTRLKSLAITAYEDPPAPPEGAHIIGLTYDFQPGGAIFDPPMTLTWNYDPETLGDVAEDSLVIAYYDDEAGVWVEMESVVDTENNTITARVPHFTVFAVIGRMPPPPPPAPADFAVSSLVISPGEVYAGESVSIRVQVTNIGGQSGIYTVTLRVNGVVEATKEVTVSAGLSKEVTFSVTKTKEDTYGIDVNGLTGSFMVKEKPAPPPAPAKFACSDLVISPGEIYVSESVSIRILVANTGGSEGSHAVVLNINGVKEAEKSVTLGAGQSQQVSFSVSRDKSGSYAVTVDGLSGSFNVAELVVVPPPPVKPPVNWPLIGGIIAAVVVVVGLLIFFLLRRRAALQRTRRRTEGARE